MDVAEKTWDLKLYVMDNQARSEADVKNITRVCDKYLEHRCHLEIIDLILHPEAAKQEQIVVIPTLQKLTPKAVKLLVGDFSVVANVLKGLGVEQQAKI